MNRIIQRLLKLPDRSFFLFGPRGVGKSTWISMKLPNVTSFDLLKSSLFLELSRNPELIEAKIGNLKKGSWISIDEVQKIPQLLDEVHRLIELKGFKFVLSGSSARKLKRGGANLLGGRAITKSLAPFSFKELGNGFNIQRILEWGSLPLVCLAPKEAKDILLTYVHTYIKEEIREEGIIRKVPPFIRFLEVAGALNGQQVNAENIAREAKIPRSSVDVYFSILEDTLMGHWLPPYRPRFKVREQTHPKFYWFDQGVARGAAGLLYDPVDALWFRRALETLIFHELRVYNSTYDRNRAISFYRTQGGVEIDFIIETRKHAQNAKPQVVCIEVKYSKKWDRKWEKPIRSLKADEKIDVKGMYGIYMGKERYNFNGFQVLPVEDFLDLLYKEMIF